jgi:hypothetical protein
MKRARKKQAPMDTNLNPSKKPDKFIEGPYILEPFHLILAFSKKFLGFKVFVKRSRHLIGEKTIECVGLNIYFYKTIIHIGLQQ